MRAISAKTFERFTGKEIEQFLPNEVKVEDVHEIRVEVARLTDLVGLKAQDYGHDGSMGETRKLVLYYGICDDGSVLGSPEPDYYFGSNYAYTQTVESDGIPLGVAWGDDLNKVRYVVEYNRDLDDWEGGHNYSNDRICTLYLIREDDGERIKKIRRRCEDALRKSDATTVLRISAILNVKLEGGAA